MPTIVHFDIPADDVDRAKKFYEGLFGWRFEGIPELQYWMVYTSGEKAVNGGMGKRQSPEQRIMNYIDVKSVSGHSALVEKLGGKVVVPKMPIPGVGYMAVCLDTEGNRFGLFEDDKTAK